MLMELIHSKYTLSSLYLDGHGEDTVGGPLFVAAVGLGHNS